MQTGVAVDAFDCSGVSTPLVDGKSSQVGHSGWWGAPGSGTLQPGPTWLWAGNQPCSRSCLLRGTSIFIGQPLWYRFRQAANASELTTCVAEKQALALAIFSTPTACTVVIATDAVLLHRFFHLLLAPSMSYTSSRRLHVDKFCAAADFDRSSKTGPRVPAGQFTAKRRKTRRESTLAARPTTPTRGPKCSSFSRKWSIR